ncbi:6165_t:CDS:2, partial [Gigaspora margarita]
TIVDDNVDETETLDNHNNKIETRDNHVGGIEIVDEIEDDKSLEFDFNSVVKSLQQKLLNKLNHAIKGTKQRPDLLCIVDNVPLLNAEIKPMGSHPLNKKKDVAKVHLHAKTINQQLTSKEITSDIVQMYFMDLQFDGLYRSWPFLTTKLAINESSLPLIESNLILWS